MDSSTTPEVSLFRQTVLWPVQLMSDINDHNIQKHWEHLATLAGSTPWREVQDEFTFENKPLNEASYKEFVTLMPFAQRFLYGEGKYALDGNGLSPLHIFSRSDISQVRITFKHLAEPILLEVTHINLYFFFDVDVAMLEMEVKGKNIDLPHVMDILYRFARTYPSHWESDGEGGHCAKKVEWLDANGEVLSASDYENKSHYLAFVKAHRATCIAAHWKFLIYPMVQHQSDEIGQLRYREIEYQRMPLMSYLAFKDIASISRADMVRLGLGASFADSDQLPFSASFLTNFESEYCYDRYWDDTRKDSRHNTRYICSGQNFIALGSSENNTFTDDKTGVISLYKNQHSLFFLIAHFQKAALLMFSDRLVRAINHLNIDDAESIKVFRASIRHTMEVFLRFTHRYWFQTISDQAIARDIFNMMHNQLETNDLFEKTRHRIMDMAEYLEGEEVRKQSETVVRLTVVTILGLIGTMTSGMLGMNIFNLSDSTMLEKTVYFMAMFIPITLLTFYTVTKSRRLSLFLDALSASHNGRSNALRILKNVWANPPPN